jgi:CheY-like chemotaxis protein
MVLVIPRQHFRVLCVDDHEEILHTVKAALEAFGYDVDTSHNGFAALVKLSTTPHRFQLLLTDLRMPGLDGFGLIEQCRGAGFTGPVIVYAGSIAPDDRQRLRELRVKAVLEKPARSADLIAAVREAQVGF